MAFFDKEIKKLGFGLMRLPQEDGKIDIEQTKEMVDRFMDAGFTYFDTAWAYAGSEDAIRSWFWEGKTGNRIYRRRDTAKESGNIRKDQEREFPPKRDDGQ